MAGCNKILTQICLKPIVLAGESVATEVLQFKVKRFQIGHLKLQVTFSEKGTKITPKTHIRKFEILHFSDFISKIKMNQIYFLFKKG